MNVMIDILYNLRLSVKFSTHMMNSTGEINRVQMYRLLHTAQKVSVFGVFLVYTFQHSD